MASNQSLLATSHARRARFIIYMQRAVVDLNVIEKITKNPALKHYLN